MLSPTPYGWLSQYFCGFFFLYGVYLPFWALWFKDQGISASDIGLLLGIAFATRFIANMVITPRIHKVEHLMPAVRWLSFFGSLFVLGHVLAGGNFWLLALVTILFNICFAPLTPLTDALANYYAKLKLIDYGRTRLWGSLAFIAGSTAVGYLVAHFGTDMIIYTALFGGVLAFMAAMRQPSPPPASEADQVAGRPNVLALLREREVAAFILVISLIAGSHAAYYSFSAIYWQSAGHAESVIGYLWSLGVIAEISVFATSKRLFAGWSLRNMFLVAALGCALRWTLTAGTTEIWALVLIQLLHGVTFAMAHLAAITYIQRAPAGQMVALQALYNAIPMGVVIAVMTTVSGWGYERWGANVFWGMAAMGVLACLIRVESKKSVPQPQTES
jgi:PPP family 3-phenylpropionic acid transporter